MWLAVLRKTHRWIGLLIAVPIAVQGLTGCILAVAEMVPDQRTTQAPARPAGDVVAAAQNWANGRATRYTAPYDDGYVARVDVASAPGQTVTVRIDPATLLVLGAEPAGGGALGWIRSLHEQWLTPPYGRSVVGWVGILLLAMLLTGIPIWWPRGNEVKQALTVDRRARGVMLYRQLHGATGAWIAGVLLVQAATGIAMGFPHTARDLLGLEQRAPQRSRPASGAPAIPADEINRAVGLAEEAVPEMVLRSAFLPSGPTDPIRMILQPPGENGAVGAVQVQVDLATGTIVGPIDDRASRSRGDSLLRWMHDLHTSHGLSDWWSLLLAVAGLSLAVLALTGSLLWWWKRSVRRRRSQPRQTGADTLRQTLR